MSVPLQFLTQRLKNWQKNLEDQACVIFSLPADVEYFTGFGFLLPTEREAFLVVSASKATLWYASFSPLPSQLSCYAQPMFGFQTVVDAIKLSVAQGEISEVIFDASNLSVSEHSLLLQVPDVKLSILDKNQVWQLRINKDQFEQQALLKASQITTTILADVIKHLAVGQTENDISWQLEKKLREAGANALAFPTIVAFGDNTSLPHHQPTDRKLTQETAVLIDVGGKFDSYCADMTRSFWFGKNPPAGYRQIQQVVHQAYNEAINWLKHELDENQPVIAKNIDNKARQVIIDAGFGKEFVHTTGHGLGIEIHEPPSLSWRNETFLPNNACITIEPGIYLINQYGYRYENTIQIQNQTLQVLTDVNQAD